MSEDSREPSEPCNEPSEPCNEPSEPCNELLKKVQEGMSYGNIQLQDVEDVLAKETFTSNMLATTTKGVSL